MRLRFRRSCWARRHFCSVNSKALALRRSIFGAAVPDIGSNFINQIGQLGPNEHSCIAIQSPGCVGMPGNIKLRCERPYRSLIICRLRCTANPRDTRLARGPFRMRPASATRNHGAVADAGNRCLVPFISHREPEPQPDRSPRRGGVVMRPLQLGLTDRSTGNGLHTGD